MSCRDWKIKIFPRMSEVTRLLRWEILDMVWTRKEEGEEEESVSVVKLVCLAGWLYSSNLRVCKHRIPPLLAQDTLYGVRYPKLIPSQGVLP